MSCLDNHRVATLKESRPQTPPTTEDAVDSRITWGRHAVQSVGVEGELLPSVGARRITPVRGIPREGMSVQLSSIYGNPCP